MDRITLRGMRVFGRHGADPGERERPQPFDVELAIEYDAGPAARSDDLQAAVDYAALHARVTGIVATTSFALLERLAAEILEATFADARIARAEVSIAKPGILDGATATVTLARSNPRHPG